MHFVCQPKQTYLASCDIPKIFVGVLICVCVCLVIFEESLMRLVDPNMTVLGVQLFANKSGIVNETLERSISYVGIQKLTPVDNTSWNIRHLPDSHRGLSYTGCGEECDQMKEIRKHVDCASIMEGDVGSIDMVKHYMKYHPNPVIPERVRLHTDCGVYRNNPFYRSEPNGDDERNFPVAYSIVVHKNPVQLERLIRAIYWPQNIYCIHVDKKAPSDIFDYVKHASKCLSNVIMTKQENVTYAGFSRLKADLNCMEDLLRHDTKWKYIINLTGQEFPLKTNREIVNILQIYNGSNDIEGIERRRTFSGRFENKWKVIGSRLEKQEEVNPPPPGNITVIKGSAFGVFSRQFVEFIFRDNTTQEFLKWLQNVWSPDEFFWATLNSHKYNPHLNAPGGYAGAQERKPWLAKYASWPPRDRCARKAVHGICIFTSADLPVLISRRELFANKFQIEKDYIVLHCLEEWIHNKTSHPLPFDYQFYRDLPFINRNSKIS